MVSIYNQLREILNGPKVCGYSYESTDDETDDNEQPDTTDMFDVESEKSPEQRRNQEGQGLKILTPIKCLVV